MNFFNELFLVFVKHGGFKHCKKGRSLR